MIRDWLLEPPLSAVLTLAAVMSGATLAVVLLGHPRAAFFTGPLAAAAVLTVLRHLVNRETRR